MSTFELQFQPDGIRITAKAGERLTDVMARAGIAVQLPCGGTGRCGKCTVEIHPDPPEPTPFDHRHLTEQQLADGTRLACMINIDRDMRVLILPGMRVLDGKILVNGASRSFDIDVRNTDDEIGMAFDIGTTTVVGTILNLADGRELAHASRLNAQVVYGEDTISRINYVCEVPDGRTELQAKIVTVINEIVTEAIGQAGIIANDVTQAVVVGNTTMTHLLLGLDPTGLAQLPFVPATVDPVDITASDAGIVINPRGNIHVLPNIAGFVGSDMVAVMLACDYLEPGPARLAVDVGTNGELALRRGDEILVCSTAAGPALEGATLSCGMRAAPGAIEHVRIEDGDLIMDTIGDTEPVGLCGSGIIDLVSCLLDAGVIDETGMIVQAEDLPYGTGQSLRERIITVDDQPAVLLYRPAGNTSSRNVVLTQRDVRQIQLAKGAIRAGINLLLAEAGMQADDLEELLLAGAFGNYITKSSAVRIGLLPAIPADRIRFVGNAASTGAKMALLSAQARADADRIRKVSRHIELAALPAFMNEFMDTMQFPAGIL